MRHLTLHKGVWYASPREGGRVMIEVSRKGFRIKGLALSPPVVTPTIPQFSLDVAQLAAEPSPDAVKTKVSPYPVNDTNSVNDIKSPKNLNLLKTGDLKKFIIQIVTISDGIKSSDVNFLLKEYLKRKKYINAPDLSTPGNVGSQLKNLVNEGILTRIRIKEVYYYYRKVD